MRNIPYPPRREVIAYNHEAIKERAEALGIHITEAFEVLSAIAPPDTRDITVIDAKLFDYNYEPGVATPMNVRAHIVTTANNRLHGRLQYLSEAGVNTYQRHADGYWTENDIKPEDPRDGIEDLDVIANLYAQLPGTHTSPYVQAIIDDKGHPSYPQVAHTMRELLVPHAVQWSDIQEYASTGYAANGDQEPVHTQTVRLGQTESHDGTTTYLEHTTYLGDSRIVTSFIYNNGDATFHIAEEVITENGQSYVSDDHYVDHLGLLDTLNNALDHIADARLVVR